MEPVLPRRPPPPLLTAAFFPVGLEYDLRILLNTLFLAVTLVQGTCHQYFNLLAIFNCLWEFSFRQSLDIILYFIGVNLL